MEIYGYFHVNSKVVQRFANNTPNMGSAYF